MNETSRSRWGDWIETPRGEYACPVAENELVKVRKIDGNIEVARAGYFSWSKVAAYQTVVQGSGIYTTDTINSPSHYTNGKVECIDAIEAATTGLEGIEAVCTGNVLKYIWRWKLKNGIEDLKKARWYLDRLIAKLENNS